MITNVAFGSWPHLQYDMRRGTPVHCTNDNENMMVAALDLKREHPELVEGDYA